LPRIQHSPTANAKECHKGKTCVSKSDEIQLKNKTAWRCKNTWSITAGHLPPSSRTQGVRFADEACKTERPTRVDPVKKTWDEGVGG
jgi:hypothetical protein